VLGILLGLGSAAVFGVNAIVTRRGVLRASSNYIANISVYTGLFFFVMLTGFTGDLFEINMLSGKAYFFWAVSGIIHFAMGRTWAFRSIQLLGATRSNIVTSLSPIATVSLAMLLLHERLTWIQILGVLFTLSGPLLVLWREDTARGNRNPGSPPRGSEVDRRALFLGTLYGAGAAVCWGSSAIFIKFGLESGGGAVAGTLIAYTAASVVISPSLWLSAYNRAEILSGNSKSLKAAVWSGLSTSVAQLLRYLSLGYATVIMASLMLRTTPVWVLLLAFIFNREIESFSRWVLLGNALLIVGTILIIIG
jgi:drug/metabolite transporter (DMT)-like permease